MKTYNLLAFALIFICVVQAVDWESRGLNPNVNWLTYQEATEKAKENGKHTMVLFTKPWCGACKTLKKALVQSKKFEEACQQFNVVNVEEDSENPKDNKFSPDGAYIPRVFFVSSDGVVETDIYNQRGSDKHKYYYSNDVDLVQRMKGAKIEMDYRVKNRASVDEGDRSEL
eukprot:TRINITY_DN5289_c0_g1_i1.p1 TRINITY_DN5289_c0_g1~~TRINITY_DN5289_c0_g1_i1.p1  ORF type:complete len:171 (-),score=25.04 TRINITY_DN5289_c0_g1_i1:73-585(-)